jgi:SAM-dependent methyltransferase
MDTEGNMDTQMSREVHAHIAGLIDATWAFSALAAASEIGLLVALVPSCTAAEAAARSGIPSDLATALLDVLLALGLADRDAGRYQATPAFQAFLAATSPDDLLPWLRSQHLQSRQMVDGARHGDLRPGWTHTDPELLQAQGRSGRAATRELAKVFPLLPGLHERLQAPGATFLDVGLGVGIVSIELCRIYPALRVVGLEPGEAPAWEARRNIAEAGFADRIAVQSQRVEALTDQAAFDLAYFPQVYMPLDVVRVGLQRVYDALRPGGWITVVAISATGDDLHAGTARLVNILWGGSPLSAEEVADMTRAAGFEAVQIGGAPGSVVKGIGGRRPFSV